MAHQYAYFIVCKYLVIFFVDIFVDSFSLKSDTDIEVFVSVFIWLQERQQFPIQMYIVCLVCLVIIPCQVSLQIHLF